MRTLLLLSTVPTVIGGSELKLSNQLNAFMNADGLLQNRKLPRSLISDVRGLLKENLIEELFSNDELNTRILDTGSSLICTSHKSNLKGELSNLYKKQRRRVE